MSAPLTTHVLRKLELLDTPGRKERLKGSGASKANADINVTPLVDVVLVLLIIFMVVTPMLDRGVDLPEVLNPVPWDANDSDLQLTLKHDGSLFVGKDEISFEVLPERVRRGLARNVARPVYLEIDKRVSFGQVREVLTALRDNGARDVGLASAALDEEDGAGADSSAGGAGGAGGAATPVANEGA